MQKTAWEQWQEINMLDLDVEHSGSPTVLVMLTAAFVHTGDLGGSGPPSHVVWEVSHWGRWIWTGPATASHPVPLVTRGMCLWESSLFSGPRLMMKKQSHKKENGQQSPEPPASGLPHPILTS